MKVKGSDLLTLVNFNEKKAECKMFFPQLYTITSYSLLQSTIRIREYVQEAKKRGYTSLAITDKDVLYGAPEFYRICVE